MFGASSTSSVRRWLAMAHPTTTLQLEYSEHDGKVHKPVPDQHVGTFHFSRGQRFSHGGSHGAAANRRVEDR